HNWRLPDELLKQIPFEGKLIVIGKKRSMDAIDELKSDKRCIFVCPLSPGSSCTMEVIDRLICLPRIIPSSFLNRMETSRKVYQVTPWLIASIGTATDASAWRDKFRQFFSTAEQAHEPKKIQTILSLWSEGSTIHIGKSAASSLSHAIKAASISDFEPNWHSHSLAKEDEDAQYR